MNAKNEGLWLAGNMIKPFSRGLWRERCRPICGTIFAARPRTEETDVITSSEMESERWKEAWLAR